MLWQKIKSKTLSNSISCQLSVWHKLSFWKLMVSFPTLVQLYKINIWIWYLIFLNQRAIWTLERREEKKNLCTLFCLIHKSSEVNVYGILCRGKFWNNKFQIEWILLSTIFKVRYLHHWEHNIDLKSFSEGFCMCMHLVCCLFVTCGGNQHPKMGRGFKALLWEYWVILMVVSILSDLTSKTLLPEQYLICQ